MVDTKNHFEFDITISAGKLDGFLLDDFVGSILEFMNQLLGCHSIKVKMY